MSENFVVHVLTDGNHASHQDSQRQPAPSTCGHGPGLLPAGRITERLHLSAAEGVGLQTQHAAHTQSVCLLWSFVALESTSLFFFYVRRQVSM